MTSRYSGFTWREGESRAREQDVRGEFEVRLREVARRHEVVEDQRDCLVEGGRLGVEQHVVRTQPLVKQHQAAC